MEPVTKLCPACSEQLNFYARACSCGWKQGQGRGAKDAAQPSPDALTVQRIRDAYERRRQQSELSGYPTPYQVARNVAKLRDMIAVAAQRKPGRSLSICSSGQPPIDAGDAWEPEAA